jgi:prolyl oligopeptidase
VNKPVNTPVYPATRRDEAVDDYFGTKVADPYRWLEDDNSEEVKAWVEAQNKVTFAYLEGIPERDAIRRRLTSLWNYEKFMWPFEQGGRYFYLRNTGLQDQFVLYVADGLREPARVLLDPNTLSEDGTVSLTGLDVTEDGSLMAYALSEAGSDWQVWKVRDVASGKDLADEVRWSKVAGASWLKDGSGFFYSCFDEPTDDNLLKASNKNHKVCLHLLGTPQSDDRLIYARPDQPEWYLRPNVTDDGRWLLIHATHGTRPETAVFLKDLERPRSEVVPLLGEMDADHTVIGNDSDTFFVHTARDAPRYRLVAMDYGAGSEMRELIPEAGGRDVMHQVSFVGGRFFVNWMRDAHSAVEIFDGQGRRVKQLRLPGLGTAVGFNGRPASKETFYVFTSFGYPATIYRYDFETGRSSVWRRPKVDFDPAAWETMQVFYASKDGTRVPMFIVHRHGLERDGTHPTLLLGYGGFGVSITPFFSLSALVWLEMGGVLAVANLRGGGEYGREWQDAGRLTNKQNVFDDFIAAAEHLIEQGYTSAPKLAIQGGSNGGLLVGACLTQRPDLFGACLPAVGVLDMLRFHRFTLGWGWTSDYGSSDTQEGFETLIKYSPLHNVKNGTRYPATLITTGDHDDRVVPAHSFKFAATLQAAQAGEAPALIRVETRAGHGMGKPTAKIIEENVDSWGFLVRALNIDLPPGF